MTGIKFPCGVCSKSVANNHRALCCDSCDKWVHMKCNFLNKKTYQKLQKDESPWFCINCVKDQLPFQSQINSDPQKYILSKNCTLKDFPHKKVSRDLTEKKQNLTEMSIILMVLTEI